MSEIHQEKFEAARALLMEETTSLDKLEKIGCLIKGVNPKIDDNLEKCLRLVKKINKISKGEVVDLGMENLPEKTEKQKKRKKLLLLLLGHWKDLRSEVERVQSLKVSKSKTVDTAKIVATMKGPLGMITVAAAGIVAVCSFLNSRAVNVTIKNVGCKPIRPISERVVNLPGLKLPSEVIASGGEGVAKIPGLKFTVAMNQNGVNLSAFNFSRNFKMANEVKEVIYDGQPLMGKTTTVDLGSQKEHSVVLRCN